MEEKFNKEGLTYEGIEQGTKQWGRLKTYGGKLVENIVQATARDCLAEALFRVDKAGYKTVMHVHDEIIADAPYGFGSLKEMTAIMGEHITWAPGLPLRADGYETSYYKKD
jgi:DNA polymerase